MLHSSFLFNSYLSLCSCIFQSFFAFVVTRLLVCLFLLLGFVIFLSATHLTFILLFSSFSSLYIHFCFCPFFLFLSASPSFFCPSPCMPQLRNAATTRCLDTMGHTAPSFMGVAHCHGFGNNQVSVSRVVPSALRRILPAVLLFQGVKVNVVCVQCLSDIHECNKPLTVDVKAFP